MMTTFVYPSVRLLLTFNLHPPDGDTVVITHYVSHQVAILLGAGLTVSVHRAIQLF